jgi:hypothetical protein
MSDHELPPSEIAALAHERSRARGLHAWARADALRAQIEAAGWRVVDRGTRYVLRPAAAPTLDVDGVTRYGSADAVPSVLDTPPDAAFTVELPADDWPEDLARCLAGLRAHAPTGTHVVIVANNPSEGQAARLAAGAPDLAPIAGAAPEVVWTSERLGHAAARNVGLRRARGAIVVLADASAEPVGDPLTPLAAAFADSRVAVAGPAAFVTADLRQFDDAPGPDADTIGLPWLAFRREDIARLGPLDEKFASGRHLDAWWSLVLRDGPEDGAPPRVARRVDLPIARFESREGAALSGPERDRLVKRNHYRLLDSFRLRDDLLSGR